MPIGCNLQDARSGRREPELGLFEREIRCMEHGVVSGAYEDEVGDAVVHRGCDWAYMMCDVHHVTNGSVGFTAAQLARLTV